jgi:hypothetical protein
MTQPSVFVSYSHKDENEKEALLTHLGGLQREGLITAWSDDQIGAGTDWAQAIDQALSQARVAILLVTANFLNSEFIIEKEVPALLARRKKGELTVFPVIARACAWKNISWLQQMNVRPKHGQPIWSNNGSHIDEGLAAIAEEVAQITSNSTNHFARDTDPSSVPLLVTPHYPAFSYPPPNPFGDKGRVTDPARFFDREEPLRQIFEELGKGVNLSVVGESQIGKSSLLSMVCAMGPERMNLPPESFAYLNLEWVDDEDDFYEALCDALGIETHRGFKLIRALRDKKYFLCLDEIEKMTWNGFTIRLRSHLRGLADGSDAPLKLVIASRSPLAHLFPDSPELNSPLAGICRQLNLGPFSLAVAQTFLFHRLQGTGVIFTEREISDILAESNGHPARLQQAAANLYRKLTGQAV